MWLVVVFKKDRTPAENIRKYIRSALLKEFRLGATPDNEKESERIPKKIAKEASINPEYAFAGAKASSASPAPRTRRGKVIFSDGQIPLRETFTVVVNF